MIDLKPKQTNNIYNELDEMQLPKKALIIHSDPSVLDSLTGLIGDEAEVTTIEHSTSPAEFQQALERALDHSSQEESEKRLAKLGLTSGEILHEISTPLSVLSMKLDLLSALLKKEKCSDSCATLLGSVEKTVQDLRNLIVNSKAQLTGYRDFAPLQLQILFKSVFEYCAHQATNAGVALRIDCPSNAV